MKQENYLKKNFVTCFLTFGIPTGIIMGIFWGMSAEGSLTQQILYGVLGGVVSGILSGLLFGGVIVLNTIKTEKQLAPIREELSKEHQILYEDGANYFYKSQTIGGWLFLLEDRLYFAAQKININMKKKNWEVLFSDIESVKEDKTVNTIRLIMKEGKPERFVVNDRDAWISRIQEQLEKL